MQNEFTAVIEKDGKWYVAYSPEVRGANGQGRTREEALDSLRDAIALILEDREDATVGSTAELERFHQFALQKLQNGGAASLEELVDLWRANAPGAMELEESLLALERGLADAAAGRVRPAGDVFRDLAARYRVSILA